MQREHATFEKWWWCQCKYSLSVLSLFSFYSCNLIFTCTRADTFALVRAAGIRRPGTNHLLPLSISHPRSCFFTFRIRGWAREAESEREQVIKLYLWKSRSPTFILLDAGADVGKWETPNEKRRTTNSTMAFRLSRRARRRCMNMKWACESGPYFGFPKISQHTGRAGARAEYKTRNWISLARIASGDFSLASTLLPMHAPLSRFSAIYVSSIRRLRYIHLRHLYAPRDIFFLPGRAISFRLKNWFSQQQCQTCASILLFRQKYCSMI